MLKLQTKAHCQVAGDQPNKYIIFLLGFIKCTHPVKRNIQFTGPPFHGQVVVVIFTRERGILGIHSSDWVYIYKKFLSPTFSSTRFPIGFFFPRSSSSQSGREKHLETPSLALQNAKVLYLPPSPMYCNPNTRLLLNSKTIFDFL